MRSIIRTLFALILIIMLSCAPALAQGRTRALLAACSDFVSQVNLGSASSGNLHMIAAALISADVSPGDLSIEDGTIGTIEALRAAIDGAFSESDEDDLSILYLCTHGVLSSADDGEVYLLLGDGQTETPLSAAQLYALIQDIQGEKLLIIDACHSGALIGRGMPAQEHPPVRLPGTRNNAHPFLSPFLADSSVHVLTSSSGDESSWYYDSEQLASGAVSYFASAIASGLGLYGVPEADLSGDGTVTLAELHHYLSAAVPSSSSQLLSSRAQTLNLPVAASSMLSRPLSGFSYGSSLLTADIPALHFSFTVTRETAVQYRLIEYINGNWDWENAQTFMDENEDGAPLLSIGRKQRSLTLDLSPEESGYLMLQVFSVSDESLVLCSERLIAVQPMDCVSEFNITSSGTLIQPGTEELLIDVRTGAPAEVTASVYDSEGRCIRRLAASSLTRPAAESALRLYWDGRDDAGNPVAYGQYIIAAEARIGGQRQKAAQTITVGP